MNQHERPGADAPGVVVWPDKLLTFQERTNGLFPCNCTSGADLLLHLVRTALHTRPSNTLIYVIVITTSGVTFASV